MPLFRRDALSPEAQRVVDSFAMGNSSADFDDHRAARYMDEHRAQFAQDVAAIVGELPLTTKA